MSGPDFSAGRAGWRSAALTYLLWAGLGIFIGLFFLNIQSLKLHQILVIIGGIGFFALLIMVENRLEMLLYVFFLSMVYSPDKYFAIVYGCSWTDGFSVALYDVILFTLIAVFLLEYRVPLLDRRYFLRSIDIPLFLLLLAAILSLFNSTNLTISSFQISNLAKLLLYYFFLVRILHQVDIRKIFGRGTAILVSVQFIFFMIEIAGRGGIADFRFAGSFANPNSFAEFYVPVLILQLAFWFTARNSAEKIGTTVFLLLNATMVLFSFSRGGWLSGAAGIMLLIFYLRKYRFLTKEQLILILLGTVTFLIVFHQPILQRLHFGDESAHSRLYLNKIAWQMVKAHPLWGVGVNTFPFVMKEYYFPGLDVHEWLHTVHNQYLLIWSEMGILGIVAFLWLLLGAFYYARRGFFSGSARRITALALGLGIFANSLHMLVDMYVAMPNLLLFLTMIAGIAVIYQQSFMKENE